MPDVSTPSPPAPRRRRHRTAAAGRPRRAMAVLVAALLALVTAGAADPVAAEPAAAPSPAIEPFLYLDPVPSVVVPDGWSATAVIQGAASMGGTLTLSLHPIGDATCAQSPLYTRTWTVVGPTYWLPTLVIDNTATPGTYYWRAAYSGDPTHAAASRCRPQEVLPRSTPPYHPFGSWEALVAQQFWDVVGRGPTTMETFSWVDQLNGRTTLTPGSLVADLRVSPDNRTNVDPAMRLYRAFFLRDPDLGGLTHWVSERRRGATLTSISSFFAASSEFRNRYGTLDDRQYVELVYRNVLGREGEPGGVAFWTAQLHTHRRTRGQVMVGFSESNEFRRKQADGLDVVALYLFLLQRSPSADERTYAVLARTSGRLDTQRLADRLLDSPEYAARIGPTHP